MGRQPARRFVSKPPGNPRTRPRAGHRRSALTIGTFVALARRVREHIGQDHRYAHCVRVARLADRLAQRHGEEPGRARAAGMLHDLARLYSPQRLLDACAVRALPVDDFERRHPIVLHAKLGAQLAAEEFGVTDSGVLDAIGHHTLGAPGMSRLAEIVYLADGLEPGRDFAGRLALERLAFVDLEAAMAAVLRSSIAYLHERTLDAAPATLAALRYYESQERRPLSA